MRVVIIASLALLLNGCGVVYHSPQVTAGSSDIADVRVVPITMETVQTANESDYRPKALPAAFSQTAGGGTGLRGAGATPETSIMPQKRPAALETRLPPAISPAPYRIGVGDVLLLATPQAGSTVEELTGLLAAQNRRQGYTVQDDGAIAIPDVGRIRVADMTLQEAEAEVFERLVESQIDPAFSLEIAEFKSQRVSIGGAVKAPAVVPITLKPLYLDEALTSAGGVTVAEKDFAIVRLYRDGTLYQIPLADLFSQSGLKKILLVDGDSVFVDTAYELEKAQAYFEEQIRLAEFRVNARKTALDALSAEIALRRGALEETRTNFTARVELGAVDRDYVYLAGEVGAQGRFALPFGYKAHLADALFDSAGGFSLETGNASQIYVLRGSDDIPYAPAITAWQLDVRNAAHLLLATRFELRPNDVVFVAEQPITRWGRVVNQFTPSLITTPIVAANN